MPSLPSDELLERFRREHPSPDNIGLFELHETLLALYDGELGYRPHEIEHVESYTLMLDIGTSCAGFVMRLESGRRVHLMSSIGPSEEDDETVSIGLQSEDMSPNQSHPYYGRHDPPGGWHEDVEVFNEYVALWRDQPRAQNDNEGSGLDG